MTIEITGYDEPRGWTMRGIDGPVRPLVETKIDPLAKGTQSKVTISLDFHGHGVGKLIVALLVRPETRKGLPRNLELLKTRLEGY